MWQKYLKSVEKVTGQVDYVSWRNKFTGWHDSWSMAVNGAKTQLNEVSWHDSYDLLIRGKKVYIILDIARVMPFINYFWVISVLVSSVIKIVDLNWI